MDVTDIHCIYVTVNSLETILNLKEIMSKLTLVIRTKSKPIFI